MSTKTTNLEMTLLAEEDNFDTNVYNENFQKTDDKIGELNSMLGSEELTTTSQTHSGAINELNKNFDNMEVLVDQNITSSVTIAIPNYSKYKMLYVRIRTDGNTGTFVVVPRFLYGTRIPFVLNTQHGTSSSYAVHLNGSFFEGNIYFEKFDIAGWTNVGVQVWGMP